MNCKFDSTGLCETHGIQMHIDFAEMDGSVCPVGHIAEVERRFDHARSETQDVLGSIARALASFDVRLATIEDKLGIERANLYFEEN